MSINIDDVFSIIILLGVIQGYFLAVILFSNRNGNFNANRFLGLLLCAFSTSIANLFLLQTGLYHLFPYTLKFPASILLLFGPLFFFYVRSLIDQEFRFKRRDWLHFIPAFLVFVRYIPYYVANNATKYAFVLSPVNIKSFRFEHYEYLAILVCSQVHLWSYLFVIFRSLKQYHHRVKDYYSNIEQRNLSWIQFFISIFALVYIIFFLCTVLLGFNYVISYSILGITVSLSIFILGYHGLRQTEIFTLEPLKPVKSESTELAGELIQSLAPRLNTLMNEEKLFTDPELNLDDLAKKLAVSRNIISQFINDCLETNFYDYINRLRVEEMKRLLLDTEKAYLTIIALAKEAGFNSKATFNRIFKQYTQMTPSEFRQHNCSRDN